MFTVLPGESKSAFLSRHGTGPGAVDPTIIPYYLLLVGDPTSIPFRFQYQLDVAYAVGRIAFDQPDDFAAYAQSVVRCETAPPRRRRSVVFFSPRNPNDVATARSFDHLVNPLVAAVRDMGADIEVKNIKDKEATADGRRSVLTQTPTLLFTATHGLGMPVGHQRQRVLQGALVCQDWPGPKETRFDEAWCFTGGDVDPSRDMTGLITFHFACFSAGTPQWDDYFRKPGAVNIESAGKEIAPAPFVAALPARLLGNPGGGALASVGAHRSSMGLFIRLAQRRSPDGRIRIDVAAAHIWPSTRFGA